MFPLAHLVLEAERDAQNHSPMHSFIAVEPACRPARPAQNFLQRIFNPVRPQTIQVCMANCLPACS